MQVSPTFDEFAAASAEGRVVPVYRELFGDSLTPVEAYRRIARGNSSFLFESVVGGEKIGRYSFLGADPFLRIEAFGQDVVVTEGDRSDRFESRDPLRDLERLLAKYQARHIPGLPRFCGGAVGYAGYDVVRYSEHLPNAPEDDRKIPDMAFAFYDRMVIFDQIRKTILVVANAQPKPDNLREAYERAAARVNELCRQLESPSPELHLRDVRLSDEAGPEWKSNVTRTQFESAVDKCKEYIRAGDIFQVVLSQRWDRKTPAGPLEIYRALRVINPSPFMFLLQSPGVNLVGSSPEIMVRVEDGIVTVRPLAGTRRRGRDEAEDRRLAEELLADPKERAEHVMLIDLARNDVGRVAKFGSVELSDVMVVERYSHVMHITSNVQGRLTAGTTALDALRAGLPAGTVSGAPKVRAMQIIDEAEHNRRGPYAGAVGYVDFTGNMDTCIALRTLVLLGDRAYIQAGAGIVADSVPADEYEETLNKAKGLIKAVELAERQLAANP
ncbi:MAG TPA: anthranilate synthase component I [Planctomycetaceae bacterium]|jgi:anthranilate synthase component 1|nr:anthranilate synthase component I [Planctomycetaceae bacterium]